MTDSPFFSVLIPTKNRAHLLSGAIQSLMDQSFADFEIVVVDNDDSDQTGQVIAGIDDPRLKYFRSGGLSLVENWEFGRVKCSGKYLTVLEDKLTYYPWALGKLHHLIETSRAEVVIWGVGDYYKNLSAEFDVLQVTEKVTSVSILEDYVKGRESWRRLPRLINSCVSAQLVAKISAKFPDGAFFNYASPDLVAAFSQLALTESVHIIPLNLEYRRSHTSGSTAVRINKLKAVSYYSGQSGFDIKDAVALVPIKNHYLIQNTVYNDFLNTKRLIGGKLASFQMDDYIYARMCMRDIFSTLFKGGNISGEVRDVSDFMRSRLSRFDRFALWAWWGRLVLRRALVKYFYRPIKRRLKA